MSEKSENHDFTGSTEGPIGAVEVTIEVEGREDLAEKILADLKSRADEINQIVELGLHPDEANARDDIDWSEYHDH